MNPPVELGLSAEAKAVYKKLAVRLRAEGYACQADSRIVALAARSILMVERLQEAVDALADLASCDIRGKPVRNPLLADLRAEKATLAQLLDRLFMSPKSRSTSRLTEAQMRTGEEPKGGEDRFFDD